MAQYLPSTSIGKVISVSEYKDSRGQNTISALEGVLNDHGDGMQSFTCMYTHARQHRVNYGRKTKKNRAHAFAVMLSDLLDKNMVPSGTSINIP